jgi:hypothetical protein
MNFIEYMPYIGYFFIFYYLSQYTNVTKYIKQNAILFYPYGESIDSEEVTDLFGEENNENEEKKQEEEKKEEKVEIKFEDKYLLAFKSFSSDYFFTEDELILKNNNFNELKSEYQLNKNKEFDNLNELLLETHKLINLGPIITEEVKELLIKYFEIEDDYADDPSNVDFDELYIYLENDHKKFQEEINKLMEDLKNEEVLDAEFQNKALEFILNKKLEGFINNYILEFTPLGNVYMRYNNFKKSFEYFSNNTIPYRYLETIGRKYVMTFRCKSLFIDSEEELKKASKIALEKEKEKDLVVNNSVSKFKSYNKDIKMDKLYSKGRPQSQHVLPPQIRANLPNVNTNGDNQLLKENSNRYTWEGRLSNMQLLKKVDRKKIDKKYAMTFSDFKQIKK